MISRRLFMRAAPAAPLAAAQAAQAVVSEVASAGAVQSALKAASGPLVGGSPGQESGWRAFRAWREARVLAGEVGDDEWPDLLNAARLRAMVLDPDLMSMKSLSPSARRAIQHRREVDRLIAERMASAKASISLRGVMKRFGVEW